jgi:hypothetical protein
VTVAAYIDLNPVRAGLVQDPKDYRWSGYGEALGRGGRALDGLCKMFAGMDLNKGRALARSAAGLARSIWRLFEKAVIRFR